MKQTVHISGWLLAAALAAAPLACAQQKPGPPERAVQRSGVEKSAPVSGTKPSALLRAVDKAKEARQATEKASAKSSEALPADQTAQAPKAGAPAQAPKAGGRAPRSGDRRDPFRTMVREKQAGDTPIQVDCGPGIRGIPIGQAELTGIAKTQAGFIAVVTVRNRNTYFLHEGNAVCNGVVQSITPDSIVFVENVLDPMGRPAKREVTKKIPAEAK